MSLKELEELKERTWNRNTQHKVCEDGGFKLLTIESLNNNSECGGFEGYASIFGVKDGQREIVEKGAFKETIEQFITNGFIAYGHEWKGMPIATIVEAFEDEKGLYIKAEFHSTPEAQAARTVIGERLARGKSVRMSIGYRVLADVKTAEARLLKKLSLFEVSLVNVPANPVAYVLGSKESDFQDEEEDTERERLEGLKDLLTYIDDLDSLLAGQTFEKHNQVVLEANSGLAERFKSIAKLRIKSGRRLSSANQERLRSWRETLNSTITQIDSLLGVGEEGKENQDKTNTGNEEGLVLTPLGEEPGKSDVTPENKDQSQTEKQKQEEKEEQERVKALEEMRLSILKISLAEVGIGDW